MCRSKHRRSLKTPLFIATLLGVGGSCSDAGAATESPATASKSDEESQAIKLEETLIDRFTIRDRRPAEGTKIRLSFVLYAEVKEEEANEARRLLKTSKHRIRNEILVAIRMCEQHEFQEPGLERLRRRVLIRLRRTVPALKLESLLIGEFEFFND